MRRVKHGGITKCPDCKGQLEWRQLKGSRYIRKDIIAPYCPKCKTWWVR